VVDLEVVGAGASEHGAGCAEPFESGELEGGRLAAEVGDGQHVAALRDHGGEKAVAHHALDDRHGHGPDAGDLAGLARVRMSSHERVVIHADDDLRASAPT
jgi:hypothetical protein